MAIKYESIKFKADYMANKFNSSLFRKPSDGDQSARLLQHNTAERQNGTRALQAGVLSREIRVINYNTNLTS